MQKEICEAFVKFKSGAPLVQCITNYVAMNISANVLLAAGASPAMVHAREEVEEFVSITQGLSINIGTLSGPWVDSMRLAAEAANGRELKWVLDPVAAGATQFRLGTTEQLLKFNPKVIRGNASEIMAISSMGGHSKGVDSGDAVADAEAGAGVLAKQIDGVVAVSGEVDFVTDGHRSARISGGHHVMTLITAMGCSLSSLVAGYVACHEDPFMATVAAMTMFKVAGSRAARVSTSPGSFSVAFLDGLYELTEADLKNDAKVDF